MLGFSREPARDVVREAELGEWFLGESFDLGGNREAVDFTGLFGGETGERLALHEAAFDGIEGGQLGMAKLERGEFLLDAEYVSDEVLEIGRELNEEFRICFGCERGRVLAGGEETSVERGRGLAQVAEKGGIELEESLARVQVFKGQAEGQGEMADLPNLV